MSAPDLTLAGLDDLMTNYVTAVEAGTHLEDGWPGGFVASYFVSKMGVCLLARVLARTMGGKLGVNHVHPGYVVTDMTRHYHDESQTPLTIDRWLKYLDLIEVYFSIRLYKIYYNVICLELQRPWCTLLCCPLTQG